MKKVFGMEPAAMVAAIEVVFVFIVTLGIGFSDDAAGVIMTVLVAAGALLAGWTTVNTRLTLAIGVVKTLLVALVYFGTISLNDTQITAFVAAIAAVVGLITRQTNSAASTPISVPSPGTAKLEAALGG